MDIPYPKEESEFETQSKLMRELRKRNLDARGEVKDVDARFDIVVFKNKRAICIIEVKKDSQFKRRKKINKESLQYLKYSRYNLPLIYCVGRKDLKKTIALVYKALESNSNSSL